MGQPFDLWSFLAKSTAKIIQNKNDVILIYSGVADYDKITNNTIFKEDVKIKYKDQGNNCKWL